MVEKWLSLTNHIHNVHIHPGHSAYRKCDHGSLRKRRKKWLKEGTYNYQDMLLLPLRLSTRLWTFKSRIESDYAKRTVQVYYEFVDTREFVPAVTVFESFKKGQKAASLQQPYQPQPQPQ